MAFRVGELDDHFEPEDYEDPWLIASVEFTWIAAFALAAAARIHPDARDAELVEVKTILLHGLDENVDEWAEAWCEGDEQSPGYWLTTVTALFGAAAHGVAELEGCPAQPPDLSWPDLPDEEDVPDADEIAERVGDALGTVAPAATNAAEWFFERRECAEK